MRTLKEINTNLDNYKNSDYKWQRELASEFEKYFDEKLRSSLQIDFPENEIREIFLMLLDQLHRILSLNDYYWYEDFTTSFQNYFHNIGHPSNSKGTLFLKERIQELFDIIGFSYYPFLIKIGQKNIDYYELKSDRIKLKLAKEQVEKMNENLKGQNEAYEKALEDKQEKEKKKIDNMINYYIQTCDSFKTYKPTNPMLEKISGVEERFWKKSRANELFLTQLLVVLKTQHNQAKVKGKIDFWWNAVEYVNKKIDFISDPERFKTKYSLNEAKDYSPRFATSVGKKRQANQTMRENIIDESKNELKCRICGELIDRGKLCEDCQKEYPGF